MSGEETHSKTEPTTFEQGLHQANNAVQILRDAVKRVNEAIANAHMAGVDTYVWLSAHANEQVQVHLSSLPKLKLDEASYVKRVKI